MADIQCSLIVGGLGADQLLGLGGTDRLAGGPGNDLLDGGSGGDLLRGGFGGDTYVVDHLLDVVDETPTPDTLRTSVGSAGVEGNGNSQEGLMSADGRWVVFHSSASNLLGGSADTNGSVDVFLKDMLTGALQRVSVAASGAEGNGASGAAGSPPTAAGSCSTRRRRTWSPATRTASPTSTSRTCSAAR